MISGTPHTQKQHFSHQTKPNQIFHYYAMGHIFMHPVEKSTTSRHQHQDRNSKQMVYLLFFCEGIQKRAKGRSVPGKLTPETFVQYV